MSLTNAVYPIGNSGFSGVNARNLTTALRENEADVVTFETVSKNVDLSDFEADANLAAVLRLPGDGRDWQPLAGLPSALVPYLPIDSFLSSVSIRRSVLSENDVGEFREVDSALREWLVRVVSAGRSIQITRIESSSDSPTFPALRPADPGKNSRWLAEAVDALAFADVRSEPDVAALQAGLLQVNDFLDHSHEYSQSVQGAGINAAGDYWHAIMHRREPDYSNAKYWFRRVGEHVIFQDLATAARALFDASPDVAARWRDRLLPSGEWDSYAFIDLCESCPRNEDDATSLFAQRIQWVEMLLLLRQTRIDALSE